MYSNAYCSSVAAICTTLAVLLHHALDMENITMTYNKHICLGVFAQSLPTPVTSRYGNNKGECILAYIGKATLWLVGFSFWGPNSVGGGFSIVTPKAIAIYPVTRLFHHRIDSLLALARARIERP
jgi:hypothetical protein